MSWQIGLTERVGFRYGLRPAERPDYTAFAATWPSSVGKVLKSLDDGTQTSSGVATCFKQDVDTFSGALASFDGMVLFRV